MWRGKLHWWHRTALPPVAQAAMTKRTKHSLHPQRRSPQRPSPPVLARRPFGSPWMPKMRGPSSPGTPADKTQRAAASLAEPRPSLTILSTFLSSAYIEASFPVLSKMFLLHSLFFVSSPLPHVCPSLLVSPPTPEYSDQQSDGMLCSWSFCSGVWNAFPKSWMKDEEVCYMQRCAIHVFVRSLHLLTNRMPCYYLLYRSAGTIQSFRRSLTRMSTE